MTFASAFEKIKEKILSDAKKSKSTDDFAIQITLTNKDCGGIFYIQQKDGIFHVEPYDYHDNDADISLSYTVFTKLADGRMTLNEGIDKNLVKINGNENAAEKICGIISPKKQVEKLSNSK